MYIFSPQIGCWYLLSGTNVYLSATLLETYLSLPESSFENSLVVLCISCILLEVVTQLKISPPIGHWSYWEMLSIITKLKILLTDHLCQKGELELGGQTVLALHPDFLIGAKHLWSTEVWWDFLPSSLFPYKEPLDVSDWLHCPNAEILTTFLDWGPKERKLKPSLSSQLKTPLALISLTWGISPRYLS